MTGPQQPEFETPVRTTSLPSSPPGEEGGGGPVPVAGTTTPVRSGPSETPAASDPTLMSSSAAIAQPAPTGGPGRAVRGQGTATVQGPAQTVTVADEVANATLAVPGVVALHGGAFGEVGTYLPGRRVVGVKTGGTTTEVHIVVAADVAVLAVAEQVRTVVAPIAGGSVDVYVEDLDYPVDLRVPLADQRQPPQLGDTP